MPLRFVGPKKLPPRKHRTAQRPKAHEVTELASKILFAGETGGSNAATASERAKSSALIMPFLPPAAYKQKKAAEAAAGAQKPFGKNLPSHRCWQSVYGFCFPGPSPGKYAALYGGVTATPWYQIPDHCKRHVQGLWLYVSLHNVRPACSLALLDLM